MNVDFLEALEEMARESGIDREAAYEAMEKWIAAGWQAEFGGFEPPEVHIDRRSGDIYVNGKPFNLSSLGRIATRKAENVFRQEILRRRREALYDMYSARIGEIINGSVHRFEGRNVWINLGEVEALVSGVEEPVVVGFFDDEISYTAADSAGTARLSYSTAMRILRLPSTALLDRRLLIGALALGADGVMICEAEGTPRAELTATLVEEVRKELEELGVEGERLHFKPMYLPIYKMLPSFIDEYVKRVRSLGKIPDEVRARLLEIWHKGLTRLSKAKSFKL